MENKIDWRGIWNKEYTEAAKAEMTKRIVNGKFTHHITKCKYSKARIIEELIINEIPFKVKSLGAGFSKIYVTTCVCPKCAGTGKIA
jgi:hypothetical protein